MEKNIATSRIKELNELKAIGMSESITLEERQSELVELFAQYLADGVSGILVANMNTQARLGLELRLEYPGELFARYVERIGKTERGIATVDELTILSMASPDRDEFNKRMSDDIVTIRMMELLFTNSPYLVADWVSDEEAVVVTVKSEEE